MEMKTTVIVLYARPFRMVNDKTGEVNEGVSIQYYPSDDVKPYKEEETLGNKVINDSIHIKNLPEFTSVPGIYELSMSMQAVKNKQGQDKGQVKVKGVSFVSELAAAPKK